MSDQPKQNPTAEIDALAARPGGNQKTRRVSRPIRFAVWLFGVAVLMSLPTRPHKAYAASASCGNFTDVTASDVFCPFILEAFNLGVTNGTGTGTTFSPNDNVPREQVMTFFDRGVDFALHRGRRTAIGRNWGPSSSTGGTATNVGGGILDIVTDGTFLWISSGGDVFKVSVADRRLQETWHLSGESQIFMKLGIFGGLVWALDSNGNLFNFNPSSAATTVSPAFTGIVNPGFPTMAFDGVQVWSSTSGSAGIDIRPPGGSAHSTFGTTAKVDGLLFDGTFMWVLFDNNHLTRFSPPTSPTSSAGLAQVEDIVLPVNVSDCRMAWDGNNLWIPVVGANTLLVVRPSQGSFPSQVIFNQAPSGVGSPYVASFDGERVMVGGVSNGNVAVFKATTLTLLASFNTGANNGIRGIASDGLTFNIGDQNGPNFFQF